MNFSTSGITVGLTGLTMFEFWGANVIVKLYFTAIDWNGNERIELSNICLNDLLDSPMPL